MRIPFPGRYSRHLSLPTVAIPSTHAKQPSRDGVHQTIHAMGKLIFEASQHWPDTLRTGTLHPIAHGYST